MPEHRWYPDDNWRQHVRGRAQDKTSLSVRPDGFMTREADRRPACRDPKVRRQDCAAKLDRAAHRGRYS